MLTVDMDLDPALLGPGVLPYFLSGLDGKPRVNYIYNMLGHMLNVTTTWTGFSTGPTMVQFGNGPFGQILTILNFGGTAVVYNGVQSIVHKVNKVLIDELPVSSPSPPGSTNSSFPFCTMAHPCNPSGCFLYCLSGREIDGCKPAATGPFPSFACSSQCNTCRV